MENQQFQQQRTSSISQSAMNKVESSVGSETNDDDIPGQKQLTTASPAQRFSDAPSGAQSFPILADQQNLPNTNQNNQQITDPVHAHSREQTGNLQIITTPGLQSRNISNLGSANQPMIPMNPAPSSTGSAGRVPNSMLPTDMQQQQRQHTVSPIAGIVNALNQPSALEQSQGNQQQPVIHNDSGTFTSGNNYFFPEEFRQEIQSG